MIFARLVCGEVLGWTARTSTGVGGMMRVPLSCCVLGEAGGVFEEIYEHGR